MNENGRTDSPAPAAPLIGLIERSTWWAFIEAQNVLKPEVAVAVNLPLAAANLAELVGEGAQTNVLSSTDVAARSTLTRLGGIARTSEVDFGLPERPDSSCVALPERVSERAAFLARYSVIVVIGAKEAVMYHLKPIEKSVPREVAPAGDAVVVTA